MHHQIGEPFPNSPNTDIGSTPSTYSNSISRQLLNLGLTVIVPILGWVLIHNDNLVILLEELFEQDFSAEFSWRLYVFYVVLFLISVSSILYSVFCPNEINNHSTVVDYAKHYCLVFTDSFERGLSSDNGVDPMEWANPADAYKNQGTGTFTPVDRHSENEEEMIDCLRQDYAIRNSSWPIVCVIALVSFVFGAVLASLFAYSCNRPPGIMLVRRRYWRLFPS